MIPHNKPTLGIEEDEASLRVLHSGFISQGKEVENFEKEFCKFIGLPEGHAVAVSSGTAALFLSLWVLKTEGVRIGFPGYVCSAVRNAVGMIGGIECLLDNEPNSPNTNLQEIFQKSCDITIIPHMFGIPIDLSDLQSVKIIEDCAQALGAKVNEKYVGLQGTVGIYSFYATKLITSGGQGGLFVSKDKELVDQVRDYREFDYRHDKKLRFNFQMTDLQAAIGRVQLSKLPKFLSRREEIFNRYRDFGLDLVDVNSNEVKKLHPVRYRAIVKTNSPKKIIESLDAVGVKAIIPVEDWELLGGSNLSPNAFKMTKETVSLPIYPSLTDEDVDLILSGLK